MLDIDIVYFSWTGNTKKVAKLIFNELKRDFKVNLIEIKSKNYPYIIWLLLSFIPNIGVKINSVKVNSKVIVICMPKWTFNCPPITSFLKQVNLENKVIYLVITYGGFDEKRYARYYANKIKRKKGIVKDILLIKRSKIDEEQIKKFTEKIANEVKSTATFK